MVARNALVCFTNCLLPQEDGSLVKEDLWIDEKSGVILDAIKTFYERKLRPDCVVDLGGDILSPGFLDIQINGAYGFDFSVYENDDAYREGMKTMAEKIVETGVTALLPTIITQDRSMYPRLLDLLRPFSTPQSATLLGWHAEGPFLEYTKRGAHAPPFLLTAEGGFKTFEEVYGPNNLAEKGDWLVNDVHGVGIRMITAAPEVPGVMSVIGTLHERGILMSIGHSNARTDVAMAAIKHGAKLITHLFNAMPQFHHRDPSIIGLLGASPHFETSPKDLAYVCCDPAHAIQLLQSPASPTSATSGSFDSTGLESSASSAAGDTGSVRGPGESVDFARPYYGIIVDGIHCHPNSVRLAYSAHPEGCILITDESSAMKILDPNLKDGVHEWRDGKRFVKEGEKLYLEGTDTLAGSVVTLDKCVRNLARFTGCSLGEAIKCVTYKPAKCLGIENVKGTLRPGAHADLVVLDKQGYVRSTWIKGKRIWTKT